MPAGRGETADLPVTARGPDPPAAGATGEHRGGHRLGGAGQVGTIDGYERFTLVEFAARYQARVLKSMADSSIRGRPIKTKPAAAQRQSLQCREYPDAAAPEVERGLTTKSRIPLNRPCLADSRAAQSWSALRPRRAAVRLSGLAQ